ITSRMSFIRDKVFIFFDQRSIDDVFLDRLQQLLNTYDCYVEYAPLFAPIIPDLVERIGLFLDQLIQGDGMQINPTTDQKKVLALLGPLLLKLFGNSDSLGHEHAPLYCFSLLLTNVMRIILGF